MKTKLIILSIVSCYSSFGHAQDLDYVIKKYVQAIGGKNRLDTIQNYTVEYTGMIDGEDFAGTYINIKPYLFRFEINNVKTGTKTCVGYDGKEGWMYNSLVSKSNFKPHEKFPGARNRGLHSQNFMNYFMYASENGYVMQLMGLRKVDSTMCYHVKLMNLERDMEVQCYINSLTFLLMREVHSDLSVPDDDPKKIYEEINYLEYTSVNGILMPYRVKRISTTLHTKMVVDHTYKNYIFNQKLDIDILRCKF
jgi:hypothetical protein